MLNQTRLESERWVFVIVIVDIAISILFICAIAHKSKMFYLPGKTTIFSLIRLYSHSKGSRFKAQGFYSIVVNLKLCFWFLILLLWSKQYPSLNSAVHLKSISFGMNTKMNQVQQWASSRLNLSVFHSHWFRLVRLPFGIFRIANGETCKAVQYSQHAMWM